MPTNNPQDFPTLHSFLTSNLEALAPQPEPQDWELIQAVVSQRFLHWPGGVFYDSATGEMQFLKVSWSGAGRLLDRLSRQNHTVRIIHQRDPATLVQIDNNLPVVSDTLPHAVFLAVWKMLQESPSCGK